MSVFSASNTSINHQPQSSELALPHPNQRKHSLAVSNDHYLLKTPSRPKMVRHYASLRDHAEVVTPEGRRSTPQPDGRREGFTRGVPKLEDSTDTHPRALPTTNTPPPLDELERKSSIEGTTKYRRPSVGRSNSSVSETSTKRSHSSFFRVMSRTDTGRSSLSGFARGARKNIIARQYIPPVDKEGSEKPPRRHTVFHGNRTVSRRSKFDFSATPDIELPRRNPEHASPSGRKGNTTSTIPIQDRRKQPKKLRLPLDMPELPSRSRPPATDPGTYLARTHSLRRSSWAINPTQSWRDVALVNATSTIPEHGDVAGMDTATQPISPEVDTHDKQPKERLALTRARFRRTRSSGTKTSTESSHPVTPTQQSQPQSPASRPPHGQEHAQNSRKRNNLLYRRWSGTHWPLHTAIGSATSSPDRSPFSVNRFLQSKQSGSSIKPSHNPSDSSQQESSWRKRRSFFVRSEPYSKEPMASPPDIVPPDINPDASPPKTVPNGEVRGQLADFGFDNQETVGGRHRPPSATERLPVSIWDSDALLMPLPSMTPNSSEDAESPQSPIDASNLTQQPHFEPSNNDSSPYRRVSNPSSPEDYWFRVPHTAGEDEKDGPEAEEIARLEWITPEHLPNSPLCPLHEKYRGGNKGFCVYHGRTYKPVSMPTQRPKARTAASATAVDGAGLGMETGGLDMPVRRRESKIIKVESFVNPPLALEGGLVKSKRARVEAASSP
ncbi:hypothetical protein DM02DRAFT_634384 [Periconia macrospinosa]|uniref:Uncharacterized protein n=1 Tax=Periconia macrospinosa TaxID=97972 RepID=A0A2V1D6E9_9PLEO|nr:hypothetical protein DM02DRAFT_634384 [Periconia macrospinosa]